MIQVWKHEIEGPYQQTFLAIIKYGDMANYALVLKENLFESFMIDEFAQIIANHAMDDSEVEVIQGDPIPQYRIYEYLL